MPKEGKAGKRLLLGHFLSASLSYLTPLLLPRRDDTETPGTRTLYELDPRQRCITPTPSPGPGFLQQRVPWSAQGPAPTAVMCRKMGSPCTEGCVVSEWQSEGGWDPSHLAECWDLEPMGPPGQLVQAQGPGKTTSTQEGLSQNHSCPGVTQTRAGP